MKRFIPYIAFLCLTGFIETSGLPLMAGGCSSNTKKNVKIICATGDTDCQNEKSAKFELNKKYRS